MKKKCLLRLGREWLMIGLLLIVVSVAIDQWRSQQMPERNEFSLQAVDLQGQSIDIQAMSAEKPMVIYFWASWCNICRFVTPTVNWLSQYYPTLGIALSSGSDDQIRRYLAYHDIEFPQLNDPRSQIGQDWHIRYTPTIMIVHQGKIEFITSGLTTPWGLLARLWLASYPLPT
ncbi:protein disulfide oxidoreductase [Vibrio metschnikovii]|uniref:protein disulfide oxidoreductase n=1 Tax=Vibrio metschnikovii TaxID=28172 RepID=UPI001C2FBA80|nr:protein disulfide oxidoreductase [Vibrio metschnikovii]